MYYSVQVRKVQFADIHSIPVLALMVDRFEFYLNCKSRIGDCRTMPKIHPKKFDCSGRRPYGCEIPKSYISATPPCSYSAVRLLVLWFRKCLFTSGCNNPNSSKLQGIKKAPELFPKPLFRKRECNCSAIVKILPGKRCKRRAYALRLHLFPGHRARRARNLSSYERII